MLKPTSKMKQFGFTGIMVFAFLMIGISPGIAVDKFKKSKTGVAIRGFDTVAFHTEKRAVKGKKEFSSYLIVSVRSLTKSKWLIIDQFTKKKNKRINYAA